MTLTDVTKVGIASDVISDVFYHFFLSTRNLCSLVWHFEQTVNLVIEFNTEPEENFFLISCLAEIFSSLSEFFRSLQIKIRVHL